ncbi:hypothetical protein L9F63_008882, partial [Diploptera punctata]
MALQDDRTTVVTILRMEQKDMDVEIKSEETKHEIGLYIRFLPVYVEHFICLQDLEPKSENIDIKDEVYIPENLVPSVKDTSTKPYSYQQVF